jgi:hypothetical protein
MEVYGLTPESTQMKPRPPRPTREAVVETSNAAIDAIESLVFLYEQMGRPRAHIDRLMNAQHVIESTMADPKVGG